MPLPGYFNPYYDPEELLPQERPAGFFGGLIRGVTPWRGAPRDLPGQIGHIVGEAALWGIPRVITTLGASGHPALAGAAALLNLVAASRWYRRAAPFLRTGVIGYFGARQAGFPEQYDPEEALRSAAIAAAFGGAAEAIGAWRATRTAQKAAQTATQAAQTVPQTQRPPAPVVPALRELPPRAGGPLVPELPREVVLGLHEVPESVRQRARVSVRSLFPEADKAVLEVLPERPAIVEPAATRPVVRAVSVEGEASEVLGRLAEKRAAELLGAPREISERVVTTRRPKERPEALAGMVQRFVSNLVDDFTRRHPDVTPQEATEHVNKFLNFVFGPPSEPHLSPEQIRQVVSRTVKATAKAKYLPLDVATLVARWSVAPVEGLPDDIVKLVSEAVGKRGRAKDEAYRKIGELLPQLVSRRLESAGMSLGEFADNFATQGFDRAVARSFYRMISSKYGPQEVKQAAEVMREVAEMAVPRPAIPTEQVMQDFPVTRILRDFAASLSPDGPLSKYRNMPASELPKALGEFLSMKMPEGYWATVGRPYIERALSRYFGIRPEYASVLFQGVDEDVLRAALKAADYATVVEGMPVRTSALLASRVLGMQYPHELMKKLATRPVGLEKRLAAEFRISSLDRMFRDRLANEVSRRLGLSKDEVMAEAERIAQALGGADADEVLMRIAYRTGVNVNGIVMAHHRSLSGGIYELIERQTQRKVLDVEERERLIRNLVEAREEAQRIVPGLAKEAGEAELSEFVTVSYEGRRRFLPTGETARAAGVQKVSEVPEAVLRAATPRDPAERFMIATRIYEDISKKLPAEVDKEVRSALLELQRALDEAYDLAYIPRELDEKVRARMLGFLNYTRKMSDLEGSKLVEEARSLASRLRAAASSIARSVELYRRKAL